MPAVVKLPDPEMTDNFADAVEIAPIKRSSVIFRGEIAPKFLCQLLLLAPAPQTGTPPVTVRTWVLEPIPNLARVFVPEAYKISPVVQVV